MKRIFLAIPMVALTLACEEGDPSGDGPGDPSGGGDTGPVAGDSTAAGDATGDTTPGGDDSGGGDSNGGDTTGDPCANVGCGAPPVCGQGCDAPCGCCDCTTGEGWCAFEGTDAVAYACAGGCYAPSACTTGLACNDLDGTPNCEAGHTVGGTITGALGSLTLGLYRNLADGQEQTFSGDGPFAFTIPLADGEEYVLTLIEPPAGQVCRFSRGSPESCSDESPNLHTCGTVSGADIDDVTVTCYDESPCESSQFFLCVPSSEGCPPLYACEPALSCAPDGSPTPSQTCCELCE